jgi:nucleoid-associated protein YgaU
MFVRLALVAVALVLIGAIVTHTSSGSGSEHAYVVRPGDTLWGIAERAYGGDPREGVWKITERNKLPNTLLRPGQRLVLPP